jgi:hypothetical protein
MFLLCCMASAVLLGGCVNGGFRVTELADRPYTFEGQILSGSTGLPLAGLEVRIFGWYQPALAMMSYRDLGIVVTDEEGRFAFETRELGLGIQIDGRRASYNDYGSEPFDPRIEQTFILDEGEDGVRRLSTRTNGI